jgi:Alpha galactosidase C-terminal beta sandwich domain
VSDDLDDIVPERRALVSTLVPPLLDGMDVLDLFSSQMPELATVPVARPWGRWRLVALFNWTESPIERELPEAVTLDERKAYHVVDFWDRRYFLMTPGSLRPVLHIPAHGVVLLGIRKVKPQPHLVTSTFHISQGAEITRYEVEGTSLELELTLGRQATGSMWLALPARPTHASLNGAVLPAKAIRAIASGVWSVTCRVDGAGTLAVDWTPEASPAEDADAPGGGSTT